jgi:hypothetical protein
MSNDNDPYLCWTTKTRRSDVEEMILNKDRIRIAAFIKERFEERYIRPLEGIGKQEKHGFCIMAISCLMIEALQSFRRGWKKTSAKGMGESAFCSFFDECDRFKEFRGYGPEFYKNVRCGILHQAETTGGWRIRRNLPVLFDAQKKQIDATKFHKQLQAYLYDYCTEIESAELQSRLWTKCERKLKAICTNCDVT